MELVEFFWWPDSLKKLKIEGKVKKIYKNDKIYEKHRRI